MTSQGKTLTLKAKPKATESKTDSKANSREKPKTRIGARARQVAQLTLEKAKQTRLKQSSQPVEAVVATPAERP